jgi:hypothetical protein
MHIHRMNTHTCKHTHSHAHIHTHAHTHTHTHIHTGITNVVTLVGSMNANESSFKTLMDQLNEYVHTIYMCLRALMCICVCVYVCVCLCVCVDVYIFLTVYWDSITQHCHITTHHWHILVVALWWRA